MPYVNPYFLHKEKASREVKPKRNQAKAVSVRTAGELVYAEMNAQGDRIPDFSAAGYREGGVVIPDLEVKEVVEPEAGEVNALARIQYAIDQVSSLEPDEQGFRGAVLIKKGIYPVDGTLHLHSGGVVLRGEGDDWQTVLVAKKREIHDLIRVGGKGSREEIEGTRVRITDVRVPVGACSFQVADTSGYQAGDHIVVLRPATANWIHDIGMDSLPDAGNTKQWTPQEYHFHYERRITHVEGKTITIHAPLVMALEEQYGGGFIYKYEWTNRISEVGIEDICAVSEYDQSQISHKDGFCDEQHGWNAVRIDVAENSWVRRFTAVHFAYSCVHLSSQAKQVTVEDCTYLDGVSQIRGGTRYSFAVQGQLNLFQRCYSRRGRHDFVLHSQTCGPNVFLDCIAEESYDGSEPHHRWSSGALYDHVSLKIDPYDWKSIRSRLCVFNRGNSGSGHGWAGAQVLFWNCHAPFFIVASPPGALNYAIGVTEPITDWEEERVLRVLNSISRFTSMPPHKFEGLPFIGDGYFESPEGPVTPRSLYLQQLKNRLGMKAVQNIAREWQYWDMQ